MQGQTGKQEKGGQKLSGEHMCLCPERGRVLRLPLGDRRSGLLLITQHVETQRVLTTPLRGMYGVPQDGLEGGPGDRHLLVSMSLCNPCPFSMGCTW